MATDKELSGFIVNEVESDDKLSKISQEQTLEPNQIFVTKDGIISENAVGLPIGSIFASAIPITDARVHLLDGSTIAQNGVYQEFATLVKSLVASGQPISCSQDEFDTDVALTGNCGKFVINNSVGTIRLPKIATFIQGLSSISNIGESLKAGVPNITGYVDVYDTYAATSYVAQEHGAMYTARNGAAEYYTSGRSGGSGWANRTGIDASKSSAIYGGSDTVQPNATQFPYYIVLASGYKSKKSLNVDNIMNEVNSKTTLDAVYPIGSIYLTLNEHGSPAKIFGGTWERLPAGYSLWTNDQTITNEGVVEPNNANASSSRMLYSGLPNITGNIEVAGAYSSGAFYSASQFSKLNMTSGSSGFYDWNFGFSAANSSARYGKSTIVQPPAYKVYAYKRVE
jgi:hypothetical protein